MKKTLILVVLITLVAVGTSFAAISGTAHDLRSFGVISTDSYRVCVPCHTPHVGDTTISEAPLWNHNTSGASYTTYTTSTIDTTDMTTTFGGISALCMSCHDGTVAVDSYGYAGSGYSGSGGVTTIGAVTANLSQDLTDDHPVSFIYNAFLVAADGELNSVATVTASLTLYGDTATDVATLECATCHDVHDNTYPPFLAMTNNGSAMCLVCHNK